MDHEEHEKFISSLKSKLSTGNGGHYSVMMLVLAVYLHM